MADPERRQTVMTGISICKLSKSYGEMPVLEEISVELAAGGRYCLMGVSGRGKTTLLRLIMGTEKMDSGTIRFSEGKRPRFSVVFQEDRLCETFSPLDNIRLVTGVRYTQREIWDELSGILPEESFQRPVMTLSGGMKRRVAIARAMMAESDIVLMDEPFTGLDEENRKRVISYILEKLRGRTLLVTTHQEEDVELLGAERIRLERDGCSR